MITNAFIDVVVKAWFWHNGEEERVGFYTNKYIRSSNMYTTYPQ
jgi:hypothetical protein